jgi:predicted nucleic-acid-binding protein
MIGLDTNVLVRYLVEDDPKQAAAAAALIDRTIAGGEQLFIPQVVLCELVWVLSYAYELGRDEIATALRQIRRGAQIVIEAPDQVRDAIEAYARGKGDFADYLIAQRAFAEGCTKVFTFDRALHSDSRFDAP